MTKEHLQEILPLITQPSRYMGTEINTIRKNYNNIDLSIALAFPDLYEIGTSHFGIQILYSILNGRDDILAERVFSPAKDMEALLKEKGLPLTSLETQKPLNSFDIIGFSLLYELNYTNVLNILELSKIPFYAKDRDSSYPLLLAGGPCTSNPEPVADFFDAMVIGDGERIILEVADEVKAWKKSPSTDKLRLLKALAKIDGVYVPAFFDVEYKHISFDQDTQVVMPAIENYRKVRRTVVGSLETAPFPEAPIVPYGRPIHDRLRLEVSRGCSRGCRFCQAGMIYRPVRERSPKSLLSIAQKSLESTGYEEMSLLSLSTGDYTCLDGFMEALMNRCREKRVAVSLPSVRVDALTSRLMSQIKKVRKTGFTIAPEAGSQRLRDVVNKDITEAEIFSTVENAVELGWKVIKLYFMIGLPYETDADIDELIGLVKKLRSMKFTGKKRLKLHVSIATFIPKPHTPFQWSKQISLMESKEKLAKLKEAFIKISGIQLKWQNPEVSLLEGVFSRGDRRLSSLLISAYQKGCRFDGWSDSFDFNRWKEAAANMDIDLESYATRTLRVADPLAWDHIDMGIKRSFLTDELQKAEKGLATEDCRWGACQQCGICDFKDIKPVVFRDHNISFVDNENTKEKSNIFKKLKISYRKTGIARFFGHLEMVKLFFRAIQRSDIPVKFSEGFHPLPKVSFANPLPVGMESLNEHFIITVDASFDENGFVQKINECLPEDLQLTDCSVYSKKKSEQALTNRFQIELTEERFDPQRVKLFFETDSWMINRKTKSGKKKKIDIRNQLKTLRIVTPHRLVLEIMHTENGLVQPKEILRSVFALSDETVLKSRILKTI